MSLASVDLEVFPTSDATAEDLSRATIELRRQILTAPVESASFARDSEAPEGAKATDALALGHLILVTVPTTAILSAVVTICVAKIKAGAARTIRLTLHGNVLELTGQPTDQQRRLVEDWLAVAGDSNSDE